MHQAGFGASHIYGVGIDIDDKNSNIMVINLDQPSFGMARENLIKGIRDVNVQHYFTYMKDTAVLFGADPTRADRELKEVK